MNKEYIITSERSVSTAYSISKDDALKLIGEEWDEEVKEKCESNEVILDKYMTKYAQRVREGNHVVDLYEHFKAHDEEYTDYKPSWLQLEAIDLNSPSLLWTYDTDTQEVSLEEKNE